MEEHRESFSRLISRVLGSFVAIKLPKAQKLRSLLTSNGFIIAARYESGLNFSSRYSSHMIPSIKGIHSNLGGKVLNNEK